MPVYYECQRCTACCRWPGQVRVTDAEIAQMAAHLNMDQYTFIQDWLDLRTDRRGLVLKNKPNGECIFLDGINCTVQPVKPKQCRDFPNRWNFPGFEKLCQAIPRHVTDEEYQKLR